VKAFLACMQGLLRDRGTEAVPSVLTIGLRRIDAADHSAMMGDDAANPRFIFTGPGVGCPSAEV
jgi:hypothetical protein